jgi:hypothetical protein
VRARLGSGWPAKLSGHMTREHVGQPRRGQPAPITDSFSLLLGDRKHRNFTNSGICFSRLSRKYHQPPSAACIVDQPAFTRSPAPRAAHLTAHPLPTSCPPPAHLGFIGCPFPRRCDKVTPPRRLSADTLRPSPFALHPSPSACHGSTATLHIHVVTYSQRLRNHPA